MFTGLIEDIGKIRSLTHRGASAVLAIQSSLPPQGFLRGDSVAVNGICLTITDISNDLVSFDVSPETIARSNLSQHKPGDRVNLERALRANDRLGGHFVTGHIDCCATLSTLQPAGNSTNLTFSLPSAHARMLVAKGSVAIDGISLTVNTVSETGFSVMIIPHTRVNTTLENIVPGTLVNIETDILGKYVARFSGHPVSTTPPSGLSLDKLTEYGFR